MKTATAAWVFLIWATAVLNVLSGHRNLKVHPTKHFHPTDIRKIVDKNHAKVVQVTCKCDNFKFAARFPLVGMKDVSPLIDVLKVRYNCTTCEKSIVEKINCHLSPNSTSRVSKGSFFILRTPGLYFKATAKLGDKRYNGTSQNEGGYECICNGTLDGERFKVQHDMDIHKLNAAIMNKLARKCSLCTAWRITCRQSQNLDLRCLNEKYVVKSKAAKANENGSRRVRRASQGCNFPQNMKTSHLSCTEYPSKIKCTQRCIFGYTLAEGISREMSCNFSENVWKPLGFQECSPFVDCSLTLVATGAKSCRLGTPYIPSECNVTCGKYEDKQPTNLTRYECQVSGGWDQKLPHCVISGSGFALVPAPKIKVHDLTNESEPKQKPKSRMNVQLQTKGRKLRV